MVLMNLFYKAGITWRIDLCTQQRKERVGHELSPPQLDAEVPAGLAEEPGMSKQQGGQSRSWDALG